MSTKPGTTASDFDPEVLRLFDQYVHGVIDRRGFLAGAARFAVGAAGATGLLAALSPQFAAAQQVKPDDARLSATHVEYPSPKGYGKARGYLVKPAKADGPLPLVLVAHENRGLNPHIEDIARRLALEGFIAFAPDALFPLGGYPGDEDAARALFAKLDQAKTREDFLAAAEMLRKLDGGNGRLGAVGFCWGGGIANFLATQLPDLAAAAPFYGMAPPLEDVPKIKAELLVVLAANDERINAGMARLRGGIEGRRRALHALPARGHRNTASTTTPRRAMTRRRRRKPGGARSRCSIAACAVARSRGVADPKFPRGGDRTVGATEVATDLCSRSSRLPSLPQSLVPAQEVRQEHVRPELPARPPPGRSRHARGRSQLAQGRQQRQPLVGHPRRPVGPHEEAVGPDARRGPVGADRRPR